MDDLGGNEVASVVPASSQGEVAAEERDKGATVFGEVGAPDRDGMGDVEGEAGRGSGLGKSGELVWFRGRKKAEPSVRKRPVGSAEGRAQIWRTAKSMRTNTKNPIETKPLRVKKATLTLLRSSGLTRLCS